MTKVDLLAAVTARIEAHRFEAPLAHLLLARPPAEDLAAFAPEALAIAAERAGAALLDHRPGAPTVRVEQPDGFGAGTEPLWLVTIVHDDMPFLFDSVMAEITERALSIRYISHPILDTVRGSDGRVTSFSAAAPSMAPEGNRVSLIQLAIEFAGGADGAALLVENLTRVLGQVRMAVTDFAAMRGRVEQAVADLERRAQGQSEPAAREMVAESARLLAWLLDDNFIFLGAREFDYVGGENEEVLKRREEPALGILNDPSVRVLSREGEAVTVTPEIRAFLQAPNPLIVTKANSRSLVHRRVYMDYIGVKRYDASGAFAGELRIVGLFTSTAYTRSILTIPYLRLKAETVIARFGLQPGSHSAKALLNTLESYPRDDLFQLDTDRLERFAGAILELGERPRVRVLVRPDRFDRFVSVLIYVPRERYDSRLRERIGELLAKSFAGHVSAYYPALPEGPLARVHFIIGRRGGATPEVDPAELEARIADMAKTWGDAFDKALAEAGRPGELSRTAARLPNGYREAFSPVEAVGDVEAVAGLSPETPLSIDFYRRAEDWDELLRLKLFHLGSAVALSTRVPVLEAMGFAVVSERTFEIRRPDGESVHLHDMELRRQRGGPIALEDRGAALEATYEAVSAGRIESDGFNALVLEAGLSFREANVLRAYARYLRQAGIPYGQDLLASVLVRQPAIATLLFRLFDAAFDPARRDVTDRLDEAPAHLDGTEDRQTRLAAERGGLAVLAEIRQALEGVESLDEDRILNRFVGVILATLRTNFYAVDGISAAPGSEPGRVEPALAFKLDSSAVEGLPAPVPFREIFVFDARVEGVHLRFGRVARGGLRWSDRAQDYRTEVLGLVKAQQVKNAVIVPVGAKGGFYPKRLPETGDRQAVFEAGRSAYVVFIASLLSVTDNIVGADILTPENVVRFDAEDPYFVVAADKGTATFSDTANAIAQSEDFWLDDAFASGGSVGYDHKAMGITARGAWEAVKRHFRETDRDGRPFDIQAMPFTAVGCGDMSGDVFGNGMLLSRETRLLAAFDHRDIFIDPAPDAAASFAERRRLFDTPRSSWADYDRALICKGGGVFSRREKEIRLSEEAAAAIGWDRRSGTPTEVITAILKAPVDLLFFGGIGTYIRASAETNAEVGDRANDALRVTGREVRAKVVGEGANLGATQRGRIEFARHGGRINTDAIDNSAGVNTSDVEVNIKIALKSAMADGRLTREARNTLLASMTDEVAELVLANNYEQTLALSLEQRKGAKALPLQARFMTVLEEGGLLNREVETLPGEAALADLRASGKGLTRPELAVLLAYSKIVLFDQLIASGLPDDPYLEQRLHAYFPGPMRRDFTCDIDGHRLRREIVATIVANLAVNRIGPTFVTALRDAAGASAADVVAGFLAAHDGFGAAGLYARIDALDGIVSGEAQNDLYEALGLFLQATTRWFVRSGRAAEGRGSIVTSVKAGVESLKPRLLDLSTERARNEAEDRRRRFVEAGTPEDLAADIALLPLLALVPDIASVSRETSRPLDETIASYFDITRLFEIGRLESALYRLEPTDYYEMLALDRAAGQIGNARRTLTGQALKEAPADGQSPVAAWAERKRDVVERIGRQITQLAGSGETSVARLTVAAGLLADLSA
ncbi:MULTISPECIES: NAD-glutamate dehydrogenase [unclassified Aureimonas]|uniref:NAD-glutamate dehydrogenase n=1 Tax=unclassified Aureimonas TaxID=2615206 RepID=UPI0006FFA98F|nr:MULTISPECIES: NAD-glutamate dehydrogenase [unclassified Aureimonas]KQT52607.1 NAD-glutamate dehydrogenase [Aureimonas sp. Leaf427]KQT77493.1 NAD-glutamate dehydrogenase [Aureimonas sp. Leaf460]